MPDRPQLITTKDLIFQEKHGLITVASHPLGPTCLVRKNEWQEKKTVVKKHHWVYWSVQEREEVPSTDQN